MEDPIIQVGKARDMYPRSTISVGIGRAKPTMCDKFTNARSASHIEQTPTPAINGTENAVKILLLLA